jgi:hypothetical protein
MRRKCCRTAARTLLVCLLATGIAHGQTKRPWKKAWIVSVGALIAVNVLDARSSVGRYETNPLLRDSQGRFNTRRTVMVKSAASGGMLLLQVVLHKRMPEQSLEKPSAAVNFTAAAAVGATAFRNTRIH